MAAGRRVAPDGGVVDAGEVRGEVDLLAGHRSSPLRRRRSGWRGGAGRAARAGCRPRRPCGTAPRRCSSGTSPRVICSQVVGEDAGPQPERRRAPPRATPATRSASSAGVPANTAGVAARTRAPSSSSSRSLRSAAAAGGVVEEHDDVAEHVQRFAATPGGLLLAADLAEDRGGVARVARGDEAEVGRLRPTSRYATSRWPSAATSGWPCGGRGVIDGPAHREVRAVEVDVVQLLPVDEPAGGGVADLRVVLPAVPQPAQHLDVVGGLVEQVGQRCGGPRRRAARVATVRRPNSAASSGLLEIRTCTPARPVLT